MQRRSFLQAGLTASIAAPTIARGQSAKVLKFVPQADLAVLDPVYATAYVTRNHAFLVYDTLYGLDRTTSHIRRWWRAMSSRTAASLDADPARRAAVPRWKQGPGARRGGQHPPLGGARRLRRIAAGRDGGVVRAGRPADPLPAQQDLSPLPLALGRGSNTMLPVMPERLARTPGSQQVTEMVGSGPYRFVAEERVAGSRAVYRRNDAYVPRGNGAASFTAGPKLAHLDRIEWHIIPDAATAAAALQAGEVDWWEQPTSDLLPVLKRNRADHHRDHRSRRQYRLSAAE